MPHSMSIWKIMFKICLKINKPSKKSLRLLKIYLKGENFAKSGHTLCERDRKRTSERGRRERERKRRSKERARHLSRFKRRPIIRRILSSILSLSLSASLPLLPISLPLSSAWKMTLHSFVQFHSA